MAYFFFGNRRPSGTAEADSRDRTWNICDAVSQDIRFDFPLSGRAHRSVNSFAREDRAALLGRKATGIISPAEFNI